MVINALLPILFTFSNLNYQANRTYPYHCDFNESILLPSVACSSEFSYTSLYIQPKLSYSGYFAFDDVASDQYFEETGGYTYPYCLYIDHLSIRLDVYETDLESDYQFNGSFYYSYVANEENHGAITITPDMNELDYLTINLAPSISAEYMTIKAYIDKPNESRIYLINDQYDMGQNYDSDNEVVSGVYTFDFDNSPLGPLYQYIILNGRELQNIFMSGYYDGRSKGYQDGLEAGYSNGYSDGIADSVEANSTALTIFNGILNVALVPINFFLAIFNWEVFGINISAVVSALLSVATLIIILRLIFGSKSKGD